METTIFSNKSSVTSQFHSSAAYHMIPHAESNTYVGLWEQSMAGNRYWVQMRTELAPIQKCHQLPDNPEKFLLCGQVLLIQSETFRKKGCGIWNKCNNQQVQIQSNLFSEAVLPLRETCLIRLQQSTGKCTFLKYAHQPCPTFVIFLPPVVGANTITFIYLLLFEYASSPGDQIVNLQNE